MNQCHPLLAVANPPAQPEFKRQHHLIEPATLAQNQPVSEADHTNSKLLRLKRLTLPLLADLGQESISRRGRFGQNLIPARSIISDRRRAHQHSRRICTDRFYNPPCPLHSARMNFLANVFRPSLRDRLPCQVNHGVGSREPVQIAPQRYGASLFPNTRHESFADEPRSSRNRDVHIRLPPDRTATVRE